MDYLTTDTELTGIADAIRTKGGTSAPLVYPSGFVSAIQAIPTGGGGDEDAILDRTISGIYENSRVTTLGQNAFASCKSLAGISMPNCAMIGVTAAANCTSLEHVSFPGLKPWG